MPLKRASPALPPLIKKIIFLEGYFSRSSYSQCRHQKHSGSHDKPTATVNFTQKEAHSSSLSDPFALFLG